jgi:hypothetical protein
MENEAPETGFSHDTRVAQSPDAISAEVGGEVVLLNTATGYFHQLNAVGSYLWRHITEPHTIGELCARAVADFEADEQTCQRDIGDFVQELHNRGLVRIEP